MCVHLAVSFLETAENLLSPSAVGVYCWEDRYPALPLRPPEAHTFPAAFCYACSLELCGFRAARSCASSSASDQRGTEPLYFGFGNRPSRHHLSTDLSLVS
jgi:hypothetical protein